ncbi:MAG: site-2 protease family protein [Acidobacteria bacterium]|nr:site-2 protease family protein [Acidobacteriota bacterium]
MKYKSQKVEIFRIWGIPVCLDYSWFAIFFAYSWTIAVIYLPSTAPKMPKPLYWGLGIVTSLLVFFSILAHELGHSLAARQEQIKINNITLHIFGGLASLEHEPKTPLAELRVAIAGPIASFILALFFYLLAEVLLKSFSPVVYQAILHLGTFNFLVACFNLLPGFPLDGGRVLRAILWSFDKSYENATRLTIIFSIFFSVSLVVIGLVNLLGNYNLLVGFWILLAGFLLLRFVYKTSPEILFTPSNTQTVTSGTFKQKLVKEFVNKNLVSITPNLTISQALKICQTHSLKTIAVIQAQQLHGILFVTDAEKLTDQNTTLAYQVMRPVTPKHFVTLDLSMDQAKIELNNNGLGYVLVIDSNSLVVGFLSGDNS